MAVKSPCFCISPGKIVDIPAACWFIRSKIVSMNRLLSVQPF